MKVALVFAVLLSALRVTGDGETPGMLDRMVPRLKPYRSFDAAVKQIETATGLKVSCPKDTAIVTQAIWDPSKFGHTAWDTPDWPAAEMKLGELLDLACSDLGLCWSLDPDGRTVRVDVPWRIEDARSVAELLKQIWKPGQKDLSKDEKWKTAFDALLCKPGNVEKALPVRQRTLLEQFLRAESGGTRESFFSTHQTIALFPMVAVSGTHYRCIFVEQSAGMAPGNGCLGYSWLQENGALAGAGLLNTGFNTDVSTMIVDETGVPGPSQLRVTAQSLAFGGFTAIMVLEDNGLKVKEVIGDLRGRDAQRDIGFGEVLLDPPR